MAIHRSLWKSRNNSRRAPIATKQLIASALALLKACASEKNLSRGIAAHGRLREQGLLQSSPHYVGSAIVSMYAQCGALPKAQQALQDLPSRDVVTWNALISGYAQHGHSRDAFRCFECMQRDDQISPDAVTFTCILKACAHARALRMGERIHGEIWRKGFVAGDDALLWTAMVDMYAKCGEIERAQATLDELPVRDVVSWSALIAGCIEQGRDREALHCYERMHSEGLFPDTITFTSLLKLCGRLEAVVSGEEIHEKVARMGLLREDAILGTALTHMYAKCGSVVKAHEVFDDLSTRNVVSWNVLIAGYAQQGKVDEALRCFDQMQFDGVAPDSITFVSLLKACGSEGSLDKGKQIHADLIRMGLQEKSIDLGNAVLDMYAKCNALGKTEEILNKLPHWDVVSWNTLISAYAEHEQGGSAIRCFENMLTHRISPNVVTFVCVLKACGSIGSIHKGKCLHDEIISKGLLDHHIELSNALANMYAKCGELREAHEMFNGLRVRNLISWNVLMTGYVQHGRGQEALACFEQMEVEGLYPDAVTCLCVLTACSRSALLDKAQEYFANMTSVYGITPGTEHKMCMVYLFGYAGLFDRAMSQIEKMQSLGHRAWYALLGACQKWCNANVGRLSFEQVSYPSLNCKGGKGCSAWVPRSLHEHEELIPVPWVLHDWVSN